MRRANGILRRIPPLKRFRAIILWLLAALVLWSMWTGWRIARGASVDETRKADAAIVMGAAAYGDKPSPVFEQRIAHAVALYHRGLVPKIILTGGFGEGASFSESEVARLYAIAHGVPAQDLLLERKSRTTVANLVEARSLMQAQGLRSALLVSDPLHMERTALIMRDLGVPAWRSPTTTSRYQSSWSRAGFLAREIYAMASYRLTGS